MEDNLNPIQMEDKLNILADGRQSQKKIMQPKIKQATKLKQW